MGDFFVWVGCTIEYGSCTQEHHMNVEDALKAVNTDVRSLFRTAHQHQFGHVPDLTRDLLEYRICGITPLYVQIYIEIVIKGGRHDMQKVS